MHHQPLDAGTDFRPGICKGSYLTSQGLALTLPSLSTEFGLSTTDVRYTTMITFFGLSFGSVSWGILSDMLGRRIAFNSTLFITGCFGLLVALAPTWLFTALLFACMGFGVGGNLPVDGALFLEFLPMVDNKLLTLLSVWWPVGQLAASLSTYPFSKSSEFLTDLS
jgi:MFS family permease